MISAHPLLKINIREQLPRPLIRSPHLSPRTTPPHRENHAAPADATDFFNSLLARAVVAAAPRLLLADGVLFVALGSLTVQPHCWLIKLIQNFASFSGC